MIVLAVRIPERSDVSVGEALIDGSPPGVVRRTRQQRLVVRQAVLTFELRDAHECLNGAVGGQAAAKKKETVACE
jgi:hypothetical protein